MFKKFSSLKVSNKNKLEIKLPKIKQHVRCKIIFSLLMMVSLKKNKQPFNFHKKAFNFKMKKKYSSFIETYWNLKCCAQFKIQTDREENKNESANDMKFIKGKTF